MIEDHDSKVQIPEMIDGIKPSYPPVIRKCWLAMLVGMGSKFAAEC